MRLRARFRAADSHFLAAADPHWGPVRKSSLYKRHLYSVLGDIRPHIQTEYIVAMIHMYTSNKTAIILRASRLTYPPHSNQLSKLTNTPSQPYLIILRQDLFSPLPPLLF